MKKTNITWRSCFLCGTRKNQNDSSRRAYHKFPKDSTTRSGWLRFCNLNETDKVDTLFLCSIHFTSNDYTSRRENDTGGVQRLKREAVPSVKIKRLRKPKSFTERAIVQNTQIVLSSEDDRKLFQSMDISNIQEDLSVSFEEDPLETLKVKDENLTEDDFATVEDARRNFRSLTDTINGKNKIIEYYQLENRKLQKELKSFYVLLSRLQQGNFITRDGEQLLHEHLKSTIKIDNF